MPVFGKGKTESDEEFVGAIVSAPNPIKAELGFAMYVKGMDDKEIAKQLEVPVKVVSSWRNSRGWVDRRDSIIARLSDSVDMLAEDLLRKKIQVAGHALDTTIALVSLLVEQMEEGMIEPKETIRALQVMSEVAYNHSKAADKLAMWRHEKGVDPKEVFDALENYRQPLVEAEDGVEE